MGRLIPLWDIGFFSFFYIFNYFWKEKKKEMKEMKISIEEEIAGKQISRVSNSPEKNPSSLGFSLLVENSYFAKGLLANRKVIFLEDGFFVGIYFIYDSVKIQLLKVIPRIFLTNLICNVVLYYYNTFFNNEPYTIRYSIVHTGNWKNREVGKIIDGKFCKEIVIMEDIIKRWVYMTWGEFIIYDLKATTLIAKTCEEILEVFTGEKIFSKVFPLIISLIFFTEKSVVLFFYFRNY